MDDALKNAEIDRIGKVNSDGIDPWRKWGAYVSERSWGTIREDYSEDGNAWDYFTFDQAHERAFRWGEDGIAGLCDYYQLIAFLPAFWNGKDPILKERYFGLTSHEGNHGEDCKEYYYHLDATPTHSYLRCLYKYPHAAFPYDQLRKENKQRDRTQREYELIDTGVFDSGDYFDVFIEYAKADPEDICIKIEVVNRSSKPAPFHLLGQLVLRNRWSFSPEKIHVPRIRKLEHEKAHCLFADLHEGPDVQYLSSRYFLPRQFFYADSKASILFTDNDTKGEGEFSKDAFGQYVIEEKDSLRKDEQGSKAAYYFSDEIAGGQSKSFLMRLSHKEHVDPLIGVEEIISLRKQEAEDFYSSWQNPKLTVEEKTIQKQALAGLLWSKQFYYYRVNTWMIGDDPHNPLPKERALIRNQHWKHLFSKMVLLVCDKWEYPWFAAWDFGFHCITMALIDPAFAKSQVEYLFSDRFQHPNGQVPAYEWEFSDLNPPILPFAAWKIYRMEKKHFGRSDRDFLERVFEKTLLEFSWWVNKVDTEGKNVFEGGFLGLDNITIVDRDENVDGRKIEQTDGTGWMGMFCLILMRMALELSIEDKNFQPLATKFFEHFFYIKEALQKPKARGNMWSSEDGFFYDIMNMPDGTKKPLKIRSVVGLVPLLGVSYIDQDQLDDYPDFKKQFYWFLDIKGDQVNHHITKIEVDGKTRYLFSLVTLHQLKLLLRRLADEEEFLSPHGIRSISRFHRDHPFSIDGSSISYVPGEALGEIKGGNSNWRGPIWLPMNYLIIRALKIYHEALGDTFLVEFQGKEISLKEFAKEIADRVCALFKKDEQGKRPIYGDDPILSNDPHFNEHIFFYEHFHGDTGRGLGATHQTGWTALIANIIEDWFGNG